MVASRTSKCARAHTHTVSFSLSLFAILSSLRRSGTYARVQRAHDTQYSTHTESLSLSPSLSLSQRAHDTLSKQYTQYSTHAQSLFLSLPLSLCLSPNLSLSQCAHDTQNKQHTQYSTHTMQTRTHPFIIEDAAAIAVLRVGHALALHHRHIHEARVRVCEGGRVVSRVERARACGRCARAHTGGRWARDGC